MLRVWQATICRHDWTLQAETTSINSRQIKMSTADTHAAETNKLQDKINTCIQQTNKTNKERNQQLVIPRYKFKKK
jgi:hypothetical protein